MSGPIAGRDLVGHVRSRLDGCPHTGHAGKVTAPVRMVPEHTCEFRLRRLGVLGLLGGPALGWLEVGQHQHILDAIEVR